MAKPSSKMIEITVISSEDLTVNRRQHVKRNSFVVVKTDPLNSKSTSMDKEGGSYPTWNEKLNMELPGHARFVTMEVHSGNKIIGSANVPVTDFMGGYLPDNYLSFLSYRLRDANGEKNGIINLSVLVKGTRGGTGYGVSCNSRPWMGVPMENNKVSGGVVTGIPVPYRF